VQATGLETYLRNHAAGIAVTDLFVVRTLSFKLGLVIVRHARRQLVRIAVASNPTTEWIAGQVTEAFPWDEAPHHLPQLELHPAMHDEFRDRTHPYS